MGKHWILALAVLGFAACGGKPAEAPAAGTAAPAIEAPATPAPATEPAPPPAADGPLQASDVDAYLRGMGKEVELLRAQFRKIEQARAAGDSDAETEALFAMTADGIDEAGAQAAGLAPERYGFIKNRVDEVRSRIEMLEGLRTMEGDTSALQAEVGDPYAGIPADAAAALQARQAETAALRAEAIGLRMKAAGA